MLQYSILVVVQEQVNGSWAQVQTVLQRRYDLIPNLVAAVKTYMKHEQSVLSEITELRTQAMSGQLTNDERVSVDNKITGAIRGMMVAVENYPDLKANENFLQLQAALNEVEEQISAARRAYNSAVTEYNNAVEMIPTNILAALMRYKKKTLFESAAGESANVNIQNAFEG